MSSVSLQESAKWASVFLPAPTLVRRFVRWAHASFPWMADLFGTIHGADGELSGIVVCRFKSVVGMQLLSAAGLDVVAASPVIDRLFYCRAVREVHITSIETLRAQTLYLFPERLYAIQKYTATADDPGLQWHHTVLDTFASWPTSSKGLGATVAVIDTSFDLTVAHLSGRVSAAAYWDSSTDALSTDLATFPHDAMDTHGTLCAGLAIGERIDDLGAGVAPAAAFVPIAIADTTGKDSQCRLARAICMAVSPASHGFTAPPADVISCSISPGVAGKGAVVMQKDLEDALDHALANDVVVVWAVANTVGAKVSDDEPACHAAVLNVGSVNSGLRGQGAEPPSIVAAVGGSYGVISGPYWHKLPNSSSFAAPLVAGVAALIRATNSALTASEVIDLLTTVKTSILSKVPLANAVDSVSRA